MKIDVAFDCHAITDKGMRRRLNEDVYVCDPDLGLFLVADGMGGESCGDVASQLTAETFKDSIAPYILDEEATAPFEHTNEGDFFLNTLGHAAEQTNQTVLQAVKNNPTCKGMGSTLTAALIQDDLLYVVHVGDSRLYCYHEELLTPLTEDHTRVQEMVNKNIISAEEARTHHQRNIITRCVGRKKQFKPDLFKVELLSNALCLICSDGLYDMLDDSEISEIIRANPDLDQLGAQLVDRANKAGGKDNITVVLFRPTSENSSGVES
ncbi:Stp1/IreP family PP2C-type Ser/Thr phosphatase [candidate division KSB1 bacterium]|nr:Stp1/IreP family PP2C-type Ser/Thr phosphatase [candidate division KSB1 bacterium]